MPQHTTTMEKTIEEWYEMFPEPIRSEALEARRKTLERGSHFAKIKKAGSLYIAIAKGFDWGADGGNNWKWDDIFRRAKAGEFDKPASDPIEDRIASIERRLTELEKLNEATPEPRNEEPAERIATDADMRPGLKVRTPEGWVGEVAMKDDIAWQPYRVSEGWGKRFYMGDANDFTILPGQ